HRVAHSRLTHRPRSSLTRNRLLLAQSHIPVLLNPLPASFHDLSLFNPLTSKNRLNQTSTSHQHPVLRTRPTRSFVLANCPDYLFLPLQRVLYEPPRQRRQTTLSVTVLVLQLHYIFPQLGRAHV